MEGLFGFVMFFFSFSFFSKFILRAYKFRPSHEISQKIFSWCSSSKSSLQDKQGQYIFTICFSVWGRFCARHPAVILILGALVCAACIAGIAFFKVTTDPVELWSAPGSRARREREYFNTHFTWVALSSTFYTVWQAYGSLAIVRWLDPGEKKEEEEKKDGLELEKSNTVVWNIKGRRTLPWANGSMLSIINAFFKGLAHCQSGSQPDSYLPNWQKCSIFSSQVAEKTLSMTSLPWWRHPWCHLWSYRQCCIKQLSWSGHKNHIVWLPWQRVGYHGNQCPKPDSVPIPDFPAKFGADRAVNGGVDSGQTNIQTFLVL